MPEEGQRLENFCKSAVDLTGCAIEKTGKAVPRPAPRGAQVGPQAGRQKCFLRKPGGAQRPMQKGA